MRIYKNITETIGNTPLVKINNIAENLNVNLLAKLEYFNPTSSIKDRIAVNMLNDAENKGLLKPGGTIIEPTSGNTGMGLAMVAAARNYNLIITMPESMSAERQILMKQMGAKIILTDATKGMTGAIEKAKELAMELKNSFIPQQFQNQANPEIHYQTTGPEIWNDTEGKIDILVAGIGTGGTVTGTGKYLKEMNPDIQIIAVEPSTSSVLSGNSPGKHGIQGIGAGFVPDILQTELIDKIIRVTDSEAIKTSKELAEKEGILCGISSGASVYAALQAASNKENINKNIVVILPDTGERYLSTALFE